jgi:replicative DNA helicase
MSFDVMDYGIDFQQLLLNVLITDADLFIRCQNILKADYFQNKHAKAIQYILDYTQEYSTLPTCEEVMLKSGVTLVKIQDLTTSHHQGFLDTIEDFCRHKALEHAVINGMDFVKKKQYGKVEELVKEAMMVSLQKDLGTEYFLDPEERNKRLFSSQGTISTGWKDVDFKLFGGFGTGELEIFVAPSGGGKSVALQNCSLNFSAKGMQGVYITLELKEELVAQRMDSMLTGKSKQELIADMAGNATEVMFKGKGMGRLYIKRMPESLTTVHDIKAYLKELQIKTNTSIEFIAVDYLDLLASPRVDAAETFMKDKFVCEELRAMAHELNITVITASQLNRTAVEETSYNHSNIAGGISKIYTADNVIGIFNTQAMRERGEIEFQFLKTRNSNGVGTHVRLAYNVDTLKISDDPNGLNAVVPVVSAGSILSKTSTTQQGTNTINTQNKSPITGAAQLRAFVQSGSI